jgi:hypothetical protein
VVGSWHLLPSFWLWGNRQTRFLFWCTTSIFLNVPFTPSSIVWKKMHVAHQNELFDVFLAIRCAGLLVSAAMLRLRHFRKKHMLRWRRQRSWRRSRPGRQTALASRFLTWRASPRTWNWTRCILFLQDDSQLRALLSDGDGRTGASVGAPKRNTKACHSLFC